MTKTKTYNMEGEIVGEIELPTSVFDQPINSELIHEAVRILEANRRTTIAHTKTRGEVRGGGKKPWKQKGTGRARHGSIRSPIWVGGGVTFGPRKDQNFSLKMNRKVKRVAMLGVLSDRAASNALVVLEELKLTDAKTKQMKNIINKLPVGKKVLVILPASDTLVFQASKNLVNTKTVTANAVSILDVLRNNTLVMPKATLPVLEKLFTRK